MPRRAKSGPLYRLSDRLQSVLLLQEMNQEEFEACVAEAISRHAAEQVSRGVWAQDAAGEASRSDFAQLLPHGRETPNKRFLKVVDEITGIRVGETWYTVKEEGGRTQFWIDWIMILPPFRRRGYASQVLELLAAEASRAGANRLGLHVLSDNAAARALYTKVGYQVTSLRMSKRLSGDREP